MTTLSDKPQTFRRVALPDGSFVKIIQNLEPAPDEPIIARMEWLYRKGTWPLEVVGAILDVFQWHSNYHWKAFEQAMTFPGGQVVCWRFKPQEPCLACLQTASSVIGEGLFDAPPSRITPENAEDYLDAVRRAVSPATFAAAFASLPAKSQRRIADKFLIEPPVRRNVRITTPKQKP